MVEDRHGGTRDLHHTQFSHKLTQVCFSHFPSTCSQNRFYLMIVDALFYQPPNLKITLRKHSMPVKFVHFSVSQLPNFCLRIFFLFSFQHCMYLYLLQGIFVGLLGCSRCRSECRVRADFSIFPGVSQSIPVFACMFRNIMEYKNCDA